ncbi:hypothetical protein [Nocardioides salarius]|uniref:hypothetical protein n=1 Tax=Nocardioides salarius TaxID=374513 RepID=UPI0030FAB4A5
MSRGRRRDERGAVAVFLAVTVSLLVVVGAFAVDLGMQRVVRRDMQALADVVALDLARELDGRTTAQLAPELASSQGSALASSLAGNQTTLGDNRQVVATWGRLSGGVFTPSASGDVPTAVKVSAGADVGFSFTSGRGAATRTAIAEASTTACHELGSVAVAVDSGDSAVLAPLNALLGLDAALLTYQNIAGVDVSLADLAATGRVGTETELLTGLVDFGDLVAATIEALNRNRPAGYAAAVDALAVFTAIEGGVPALRLQDLLSISPSDSAALETDLNVLDLLVGSVLVADGDHALTLEQLQAKLPGLGAFTGTLYVQEGKRLACGAPGSEQAKAETAQLEATLDLDLAANGGFNSPGLGIDVGLVKGTLQTGTTTGTVQIRLGGAQSQLLATPTVHCGDRTPADPHTFSVGVTSGLASYAIDARVPLTGKVQVGVGLAKIFVDVDVVVGLSMTSGPPGPGATAALAIPPNDEVPVETGSPVQLVSSVVPRTESGGVLGGNVVVDALAFLGVSTEFILDGVLAALMADPNGAVQRGLRPLATKIDTSVVGPLETLLGIRVGGADVYAVEAVCNVPALRG